MKEVKLYELNHSQEVVKLQCKYTLFKKVINIITSMTSNDELDFNILKQAFNMVVQRNDCLRLRFVNKNKQLMQYFLEEDKFENIPVLQFATKQEQDKFLKKLTKKAIKYKKGIVIEPYFIKTYDNKSMVVLKVCHLILDIYGINVIYKDLFGVYNALKNKTELPECPTSFEDVIKKDLTRKHNKEYHQKNLEFFTDLLKNNEEPTYAGIHGSNNPIWQKQQKKNKRAMKMFFINCDTEGNMHSINSEVTQNVMSYCKQISQSPANLLFYVCSLCASKVNNNANNLLPLELYNCRTTINEKNCAGTKVQSLGCYTTFDFDKSFEENFELFCKNQRKLYRHIGFSDMEFESLLHKIHKSSFLETYYYITFSFIPYELPDNTEFEIYSNGKCALPAYLAQFYNVKTNEILMAYDCQTKIISKQDVECFHNKYVNLLKQVTTNPNMLLKDVNV